MGFKDRDAPAIEALLDLIRYEADDPLVELATIKDNDYQADIDNWQYNGRAAASGDKNKAWRLLKAARVLAGVESTLDAQIEEEDSTKRKKL